MVIKSTHPPQPSSNALTVLAQTCQAALLLSFTSALTTGSCTGSAGVRPIDLHAHDALCYMLRKRQSGHMDIE